jgi:hypothetical protein
MKTLTLALLVLAFASTASGATGLPKTCPSAAVVNAALGQKNKAPTVTHTPYAIVCTYKGGGIIPTRVTFQKDTAATFAASEKAVVGMGIKTIHGIGKAAWTTKVGGAIYVFTGSYTIKVVATPLTSFAKIEALARKLLKSP